DRSSNFTNVLLLTNTTKGWNLSLTGQLRKEFSDGWFADASYTFSDGKAVNDGTSSRAISNWQFNEVPGDPNNAPASRSVHLTRHKVLATASKQFTYGDRFATTISLIYEGRQGRPFSFVYNTPGFASFSANGDFRGSNDLIFIPESEDQIVLTSNNWAAFNAFIESHKSLRDRRGQIVPRSSEFQPWINQVDFKISQRIATVGTQFVEFSLDILNFSNLVGRIFGEDSWGIERFASNDAVQAVQFQGFDATELANGEIFLRPRLSFDENRFAERDDLFNISNFNSRWRMQFGVRYTF
ncbi:MAG: hypothetical protein ACFCU6_10670, partial [Balneolaceae bacterium]